MAAFDEAEELSQRVHLHAHDAATHRRRGELHLALGRAADAETSYLRAIEAARAQGTKTFELRAATDLARLWRDQGRPAEAHDLLAPVYGWFTEGFVTADLKEARELLDELAALRIGRCRCFGIVRRSEEHTTELQVLLRTW